MSGTKKIPEKQHYIPKFYLRKFSANKENVLIYHLRSREIKLSPISSTCQESYFYGKDGEFEDLLKMMDNNHAKTLNRIIETKTLPSSLEDYIALLEFLLITRARTLLELKVVKSFGEAVCNQYLKPMMDSYLLQQGYPKKKIEGYSVKFKDIDILHKQGILHAFNSVLGIRDLHLHLIGNNSKIPFISSDNPVIFNNRIFLDDSFTSLFSRGLQIHCPINPNLYLILFDPAYYSIDFSKPPSLKDINRLNGLQLLHSNEILIISQHTSKKYLNKLYNHYIRTKNEKIAKIETKESKWVNENTRSDIDILTIENANYHIHFDFLKFNRQEYLSFRREYLKVKQFNPYPKFPRDPDTVREVEKYQKMVYDDIKK